jgi:DNA-directed RNA polymerase subunit RPC12/RpoP
MAGVDAGEQVPCPSCGQTVLQKAMIPVLGDGGTGMGYVCITCARGFIGQVTEAAEGGRDSDEEAEAEPAEPAKA